MVIYSRGDYIGESFNQNMGQTEVTILNIISGKQYLHHVFSITLQWLRSAFARLHL